MEKEDSEFEIIDMEKEAESPASIPEGRSYEEFINDTTPSKTYCINGIYFYIINLLKWKTILKKLKKN